jgi:hypothetical protein
MDNALTTLLRGAEHLLNCAGRNGLKKVKQDVGAAFRKRDPPIRAARSGPDSPARRRRIFRHGTVIAVFHAGHSGDIWAIYKKTVDRFRPLRVTTSGEITMPHSAKLAEHHQKAAEHHEHAARHHSLAAEYHENKDHESAAHHAHAAHGHHLHATHHAEEAGKLHATHHGEDLDGDDAE